MHGRTYVVTKHAHERARSPHRKECIIVLHRRSFVLPLCLRAIATQRCVPVAAGSLRRRGYLRTTAAIPSPTPGLERRHRIHDYSFHSRPTIRIGNTREQAQTSCGIRAGSRWRILAFGILWLQQPASGSRCVQRHNEPAVRGGCKGTEGCGGPCERSEVCCVCGSR